MSDIYANQKDYYINWPGRTKSEVDRIYSQLPEEDWPEHKKPRPNPVFLEDFDEDLVPDGTSEHGRSEIWAEMDEVIDGIDVLDAYERWILPTKPMRHPPRPGRREITVRCPLPDHADRNPSATLNQEQGVWHCHACSIGGDKFDIAAIKFGFDRNDIRGPAFADLKRQMAADLGWIETNRHDPKGGAWLVKTEPGAENETLHRIETEARAAEPPPPEDPEESVMFDWREILPINTPLREWMDVMSRTDIPDEFLFFGGLQMMGLAGGRNIALRDAKLVYPMMWILLIGPSASGKTRCCDHMEAVLREALPFEEKCAIPDGVLLPGVPGSGEGVLSAMSPKIDEIDENGCSNAKRVKAWWRIDEFSEMSKRKGRSGDTSESILMKLFDAHFEATHTLRHEVVRVTEPFTDVISTVQPSVINEYIHKSDVHTGYVNRWVPVRMIKAKRPNPFEIYVPNLSAVVDGLKARQAWLSNMANELHLEMTPDAMQKWGQFWFDNIYPLRMDENDPMSGIWGRVDTYLRRFMVILALNEQRTQVDLGIVERTLKLWPYMRHSLNHLTGRIETDAKEELNERIVEALRSAPKQRLTSGQLRKKVFGGRRGNTDAFNASMVALIRSGQVIEHASDPNKRGRPSLTYLLADDA